MVGKHCLSTGIQPRKGDLAVQGILVLTVGLGGSFKAGNEECSQPETCDSGCRVCSSSQCCFKGCLGSVWAGGNIPSVLLHGEKPQFPQLGCFLLCPDKVCPHLICKQAKPGAGDLSFPSQISDICPGHAVFLPRVRDSQHRNSIPSSTSWTG